MWFHVNGRFSLEDVYMLPSEQMREEEKPKLKTQLKCHLYDDLVLSLEDIFADLSAGIISTIA